MRSCRFIHLVALLVCAALSGGVIGQARAEPVAAPDSAASLDAALAGVRALALGQTVGGNGSAAPRVEVSTGQLDPRLHLAPCQKIEPYVPAGQRLWGRTRVGLRCTAGPVRWNVYLPVTVQV
ncbi:MAG: flagellar biosynthesis protein FlgA, partial [Leptothrix sp. (in: b-proteobacteria)]